LSGQPQAREANRRVGLYLAGVVLAFFGLGFAMVPLYGLICDITGINQAGGSGGGRVAEAELLQLGVDYDRTVRVEFDSTLNVGLDWDVEPAVNTMEVHPGKPYDVVYRVRNNSDTEVVAQAIPGVTPWQVTEYFNKIACFCFDQQKLAPGEMAELSLRFVLSRSLPHKYNTVTLSYTFMDTDPERLKQAVSAR
jgi:cytochrome c oxidase assembly protein subunit 11